jgi:hypothetical protein
MWGWARTHSIFCRAASPGGRSVAARQGRSRCVAHGSRGCSLPAPWWWRPRRVTMAVGVPGSRRRQPGGWDGRHVRRQLPGNVPPRRPRPDPIQRLLRRPGRLAIGARRGTAAGRCRHDHGRNLGRHPLGAQQAGRPPQLPAVTRAGQRPVRRERTQPWAARPVPRADRCRRRTRWRRIGPASTPSNASKLATCYLPRLARRYRSKRLVRAARPAGVLGSTS